MKMRRFFLSLATITALLSNVRPADAATVLAYSFEDLVAGGGPVGPDGFFGLGATVSQEPTIGVTHGSNSLKYEIAAGPGFVGARTENPIPAALNNPPGVVRVLFDLTITDAYTGTFADLGITVFGHDLDNAIFGIQMQFTDLLPMAGLAPGTYVDQEILLDSEFFSGESFNDLFGSDPTDIDVASAFQFYVSKNGGAGGSPFTFYIDNVRLDDGGEAVPEPATAVLVGAALAGLGLLRRRLI